ncbi:hypothetical protein FXO37_04466 [Capsicum annuum]|nr:hypothetical protein FXO37_04466 [Capsicum annuum]
MERDSSGAVYQIIRYEKVQEPFYFWDAFSNFLPLVDKLKNGGDSVESSSKVYPGERKVDMDNIDFEIFQKATSGGFVPAFALCESEHETHLAVIENSWSMLRGKFVSGNMKDFVFSKSELTSSSSSKNSKYIDVNFASQTSSQSAPRLSKKCPLSIAKQRGGLSNCQKRPLLSDDFKRKPRHLKSGAHKQGGIGISEVTNDSFNEAAAAGEILHSPQEIIESKVDELHMSRDILGVSNLSRKESTIFDGFHESWEDKPCNERSPTILNGVMDTGEASCNLVKTIVYHRPSLEKFAPCSTDACILKVHIFSLF